MAQFDYGDKVEYNGHKAIVKSIWYDKYGIRNAKIEFNDKSLIPKEMEVLESALKLIDDDGGDYYGGYYGYIDSTTHCPKCRTRWTVTKSPVLQTIWRDCKKCNKKKEDLV
jgi:hypothetical protein